MENLSYEAAMQELQQIVAELQGENADIDQLEAKAERAAQLIAYCREKLRKTEAAIGRLFDDEEAG